MSMQHSAAALALSLLAAAASAQAVRSEKNMSLELANQIASATVAACTTNGYAVTATVVDRAGTVRAVQRADNAGPHTVGAAQQKAFTSASAKNSTLAMMEGAQKNPAAGAPLDHVNNLHWTALIESIVLGNGGTRHQEVLRALLAAGASTRLTDRQGSTPLALARSRGYAPMVQMLEKAGAK